MEAEPNKLPFKQVGGWLCLDFVNTVNWDSPDGSRERFNSYADLVRWGRHMEDLTNQAARSLLEKAARRPEEAEAVYKQAMLLRAALHRIFGAIAADLSPKPADLKFLNGALSAALVHVRLRPAENGFSWGWAGEADALDQMLWPILWSAADLLTSEKLDRVGQCAGDSCGWLFLDTSRNRSRRWCEMEHCGNRAKARRYYHRKRNSSR